MLRLDEQFRRRRALLRVASRLQLEMHRGADQQLLQSVMERLGELLSRMLLSEREIRRHLTQLRRAVLQFERSFVERVLGALPRADVRDKRYRTATTMRGDMIRIDFDRKRRAVLSLADEVEITSNQTRIRRAPVHVSR